MTKILLIRMFSALSLISVFVFYKNEQEILDSLNQTLVIIAFLDFGLQQSAIMKYLNNKKALFIECIVISIIIGLAFHFKLVSILTLQIVFIAYVCNIIQAIMYRKEKINHVFIIILARILGIFLVIEFKYSILMVFFYFCLLIYCVLFYMKDEGLPSFFSKRFELGVITTVAVLNEQIIRLEVGLSYKESIIILTVGYVIGVISMLQQSLIQYIFSENKIKKENILNLVSFRNFSLTIFFCVLSIVVIMFAIGIINLSFYLMVCMMVVGNIAMRYSLLIDNVSENSLKSYVFLNFTVLFLTLVLMFSGFSFIYIQIYVSLVILIFTVNKLKWNIYK